MNGSIAAADGLVDQHTGNPEQGQLVEVRRRQWVVSDVGTSAFHEIFAPGPAGLVTLVPVDEDSLGEELQIIWQLEPGARVINRAGLPTISGCDDATRLEAFLDAVNWGAASNADRSFLQSPFRSGASIESYQLDPVVRAIDMARVNLLIADDVGLGKTIEAGLVIQELLVRHRARTVLVVCPSSLQLKWQLEMQEKFGLEFRVVDTEYLKGLRREQGIHANPWTSFPRLITSMDWMKSGEAFRLIKDVLPPHITYPRKFDILVVDEAHNVAPAMATRYALESQRTSLIRKIASHFEHRIFLSATPHNGYQESFTSLLELLDDQRFARNVMPEEKQLQRVMVRRLKTDLVDADGKPIYPKREIKALEVGYTLEERDAHKLLRQYAESLTQTVAGTKREFGSQFILNLLKKRLFSSPRAFAITLEKHRESLEGRGKKTHASALDDRILRKAIGKLDEEYASDEGLEQAIGEAIAEAGATVTELSAEQKDMLKRLSSWAETAKGRPDSKAKAILAWLDVHLKTNGKWNGARVILFTEYRATHGWLFEILTNHGYGGERLAVLHGSLDPQERAKVTAAFQATLDVSPVRILLATDAASEGIDLQNHCNFLIHVEIPWNPNVMEQRNGRIVLHDLSSQEMLRGLREGRLDVALTVEPSLKRTRGVAFATFRAYPVCVAVKRAHRLARARHTTLARLNKERFIVYSRAEYPDYHERLNGLFGRAVQPLLEDAEEHDSGASLAAAIEAGRGIAILTTNFSHAAGSRLKLLEMNPAPEPVAVGFAYRPRHLSPVARRFVKAVSTLAQ